MPSANPANPHDLQLLGNGNYLVGAWVKQSHVNTRAYGGSRDTDVANAELQEVSSDGQLLWDWKSQDHISLAETGRHWRPVITHPIPGLGYDIAHWNSIEPAGKSVIASFRNVDAVYKIKKSTGKIVWKLGGTRTPQSLTVKHDPHNYTLGAQHDARLLPDGTLTLFDNRTKLPHRTPRAVRYRINQRRGTATLLRSITDPDVSTSNCCGSARRLPNRDWLISWGKARADRWLQAQRKKDLPLELPPQLQLSRRAGPEGRGLGARSARRHEGDGGRTAPLGAEEEDWGGDSVSRGLSNGTLRLIAPPDHNASVVRKLLECRAITAHGRTVSGLVGCLTPAAARAGGRVASASCTHAFGVDAARIGELGRISSHRP